MTKEACRYIGYMIQKECCRNDLSELCEYYGVTTDEFWEYQELAEAGYKAKYGDGDGTVG